MSRHFRIEIALEDQVDAKASAWALTPQLAIEASPVPRDELPIAPTAAARGTATTVTYRIRAADWTEDEDLERITRASLSGPPAARAWTNDIARLAHAASVTIEHLGVSATGSGVRARLLTAVAGPAKPLDLDAIGPGTPQ